MKLDQYIRMKMIELSEKYEMSLVEITKVKDQHVNKAYNFNYRLLGTGSTENKCERFYNKRELVSWLLCLE